MGYKDHPPDSSRICIACDRGTSAKLVHRNLSSTSTVLQSCADKLILIAAIYYLTISKVRHDPRDLEDSFCGFEISHVSAGTSRSQNNMNIGSTIVAS